MNDFTASTQSADSGARKIAVSLLNTKAESLNGGRAQRRWFQRPSVLLSAAATTCIFTLVAACVAVGIRWNSWPLGAALLLPFALVLLGALARIPSARDALSTEQHARLTLEHEVISGKGNEDSRAFPGSGQLALRRAENLLSYIDVERRIDVQAHLRNILTGLLAAVPAAGAVFYAGAIRSDTADYKVAVVALAIVFELAVLAGFQAGRSRLRSLEAERSQLAYERNLLFGHDSSLERAEKFFLKQEFEAKRYYDEQLRQSSMYSYLGIVCIGAGFAVIGAVLYVLSDVDETSTSITLGALGITSAILTNFVAFSLVRMHAATVETLQGFHSRMADMQTAHLKALERARREIRQSQALGTRAHAASSPEPEDDDEKGR